MSPVLGPYLGLLAALAAAAPLSAAGTPDDGVVMVAICTSDGVVRMMPLSLGSDDEPAPAPDHGPVGCHAPCLHERRDGADALTRAKAPKPI
ncbi:MAG: hypothetical protein AAFR65_02715 [Pseudomonadota bacterium]